LGLDAETLSAIAVGISLVSVLFVAWQAYISKKALDNQGEELELHRREQESTKMKEYLRKVKTYHDQKLRELVWVKWIQGVQGYPFVATSDTHIRPILEKLGPPYERYFQHAMEHLMAFKLLDEWAEIHRKVDEHNIKADRFEASRRLGQPKIPNYDKELDAIGSEQNQIWTQAQEYGRKIQGVVNDLEDGQLIGECEFEQRLRNEMGLKKSQESHSNSKIETTSL